MQSQENQVGSSPNPGNGHAAPASANLGDLDTNKLLAMSGATISTRGPIPTHGPSGLFPFLDKPEKAGDLGLLGHYRVIKQLGGGGMGLVFLAEDPRLQRFVALKVMRPELAQNAIAKQRFLREARATAALRSDYIVAIHDIGEVKELPYFSADLLHGMPLDVYLLQEPALSISAVLSLGIQIARGLEAAHGAGLVHRDIKPANIWLEPHNSEWKVRSSDSHKLTVTALHSMFGNGESTFRVKLLDFGLSRSVEENASLTQCGMIVGTPTYMAPEQSDGLPADARSDLFSLGCVLYEAASGKKTFDGNSVISILKATALQEPPSLHGVKPEVPLPLSKLVMRLLAKDPDRRPQTATEVVKTLEEITVPSRADDVAQKPASVRTVRGSRRLLAWFGSKNALMIAVSVELFLVGLLWLAPGWLPRPSLWSDNSKETSKSATVSPSTTRGVMEDEIVLGMSAPVSGPAREIGREIEIGIQTCLRQVNADGGVAGRKLRLVTLDDACDPERALANMKRLVEDEHIFAVIGNVGATTAEKALPYALSKKLVFFSPFTGAALVRNNPPDRYVFNYRASFGEEAAETIKYLKQARNITADQLAVFAEEGANGNAAFNAVARVLRQQGHRPEQILRVSHKRNSSDVASAVKEVLRHEEIRAVIMATTYRPAAAFVRQVKDAKRDLVFTSVSCVGSDALAEELRQLGGNYANGVIVIQSVPQPDSECSTVLRYREQLHTSYPNELPSYVSLEGYIATTVFVEALRRTGNNLTTESFVDALESIRELDVGLGTPLHFGPSEHQGSHKVWGTVLDESGQFQPLELD